LDGSSAAERTGSGNYTFHLVSELLNIDRENQYVVYFRRHGLKRNPLFLLDRKNLAKIVTDQPSGNLRVQTNLAWRLYRDCVDLYHGPGFFLPLLWPGRCVVTMHDLNFVLFPGHWSRSGHRIRAMFLRAQARAAAQRADRIVTGSRWSARVLTAIWRIPERRILVTPYGFVSRARGLPSSPPDERVRLSGRYILSVSHLTPNKNYEGLMRGFARLLERLAGSEDLKLVISGNGADRYARKVLRPLVARLGLEGRIALTGFVPDTVLQYLYEHASAFALLSRAEGFGLPLLEAMSAGVPIVASNVSALPEIAADAALLVNPGDEQAIAEALERVLYDRPLRERLIENGFRRCAAFSWRTMAEQTLPLYCEVQARGKAT